jgi:hypothetical protein
VGALFLAGAETGAEGGIWIGPEGALVAGIAVGTGAVLWNYKQQVWDWATNKDIEHERLGQIINQLVVLSPAILASLEKNGGKEKQKLYEIFAKRLENIRHWFPNGGGLLCQVWNGKH